MPEGLELKHMNRFNHSLNYALSLSPARPPVDTSSKRPSTDTTGYILCVYKVFKGDDGEKFERNWLYWTGENIKFLNE